MRKLILPTLQTFVIGALVLGLLLFIPAGTLNYWQAWVFIVVFMVSVNIVGLYLSLKDPALLERRKKFGPAAEQNPVQKVIISLAVVSILALLIFCGLAHRFGWGPVPALVALLGDVLVAAGLMENVWVFSANSFGGSTVEIRAEQKVISTGPYAAVRHPMYVGVLIMMIGVPLALGAWWGLAVVLVVVPALVLRILDEEKSLRTDLPGYSDYAQKVRYRLVPYLW
jgi:protein-S-isoprenylcysteine O-methyltransferase Ste14